MTTRLPAAFLVVLALGLAVSPRPSARQPGPGGYDALGMLFREWRAFQKPPIVAGVPDYGPAAMARQRKALASWQARLGAIDARGWTVSQQIDRRLVEAEMAGLAFDHRTRRPWARDPAFYVTAYGSQTDVPLREGPVIEGAIELWTYAPPLDPARLNELRTRLAAIPAIHEQARRHLVERPRDLWRGGIRAKRDEAAAIAAYTARVTGVHDDLVPVLERARAAVDGFRGWLEQTLPQATAASGVGVAEYDWNLRHVHLLPYTWEQQHAIVQRELARALSALALEEHRNRELPPLAPVSSAAEHTQRFGDAVTEYMAFLKDREILTVAPYMDAALRARVGRFAPASGPREFFSEVDYRDPVVMRTHGSHWFDLARLAQEPHASPIRREPSLSNIWDARAEGLATGLEEMMMHAGLFDRRPRARELVYVLLAQRAARAMGDLMMHANRWTIDEAATYAVDWTPRGWLRADGETVWGEQHLYLQQPAYGTSYVIGKVQIEQLLGERARQLGPRFSLRAFMDAFHAAGMIPVSLIRWELTGEDDRTPVPVR